MIKLPLKNKNNKQAQQETHSTLYILRTPLDKQPLGSSCSLPPPIRPHGRARSSPSQVPVLSHVFPSCGRAADPVLAQSQEQFNT